MTTGQQFTHDGERYQIDLIGPNTCLCYLLSTQQLYRFETNELEEILRASARP